MNGMSKYLFVIGEMVCCLMMLHTLLDQVTATRAATGEELACRTTAEVKENVTTCTKASVCLTAQLNYSYIL